MPTPAGFTETYLVDYVKTRLGAPRINVELDEPQIEQAISDTIEDFQRYRPIIFIQGSTLSRGTHRVTPPDDTLGLTDIEYIYTQEAGLNSPESALLYDPFYLIAPGNIGSLDVELFALTRQWLETVGMVFGQEFDYAITDQGLFVILPRDGKVSCRWAMPYENGLGDVRREYQTLFQNLTVARSRVILGQIRSKFAGVPGAGGQVQLDGEWQRDKGLEDEARYMDELMRTAPHFIPSLD